MDISTYAPVSPVAKNLISNPSISFNPLPAKTPRPLEPAASIRENRISYHFTPR
jgi:hypothetical protein